MIKYLKKDYIFSNWSKIREILLLLLLFSYIILRLYNTSLIFLGEKIWGFDSLTGYMEKYGFPVVLVLLYIFNLAVDKTYFKIKTEALKIIPFIVFAIVSAEHIGCLVLGAFVLCSDFSSIKKISAVSAAAIITGTLGVILASQTGVAINNLLLRPMGRYAHYFGFYHYAVWARQILYAFIFFFVSKTKKLTLADIGIFALVQAVVYYYSTQRLTFVISILAVIVFIVFVKYEIIKINTRLISSLSLIAFPAAMAGSIWISLIYDTSNIILAKINNIINGRLYLQRITFDIFSLKLFGQQVHNVTDFYFFLDNSYLYALFAFGIILTAIIIAIFSYILWRSCKTNNTTLFALMVIVLVYLLIDGVMTDLSFIGPVFLFFPVLLKEHLAEKQSD